MIQNPEPIGGDDDDVRLAKKLLVVQQPVQSRHADVIEALDAAVANFPRRP